MCEGATDLAGFFGIFGSSKKSGNLLGTKEAFGSSAGRGESSGLIFNFGLDGLDGKYAGSERALRSQSAKGGVG
jgi:hypothetical protein